MSRKSGLLLVVLLIVSFVAAACGGDNKDNKESSGSALELKQEFKSTTGITVKYPDGWIARDSNDGAEIANKAEIFDVQGEEEVPSGALGIVILPPVVPTDQGLAADASAKDLVSTLGQNMAGNLYTLGDMQDTQVGGKDAVRMDLKGTKNKAEGFMVGYKVDDTHIIVAFVGAHEGELSQYEATAMKIIESVTYTAPAP